MILSLSRRGVALDPKAAQNGALEQGNIIGGASSFQTVDGQSHLMADVWFKTAPVTAAIVQALSAPSSSFASLIIAARPMGRQLEQLTSSPLAQSGGRAA